MAVEDPLGAGRAALAEGRWEAAREAFQEALRRGQSAEALDGLGEALWWLGEPGRGLELREQAYARFRRAGDQPRAIAAALGVAVTYEANFDNRAAANGWVGRAGRLLRGEDDPLAGWVWMTAAYVSADPAEAVRLCERALDVARAQGDADLELCSLSGLGEKLVLAGQIERGLALIDEAMAGTLGGERSRLDTVAYTCCDMLVACDLAADLERARQWCQVADRFIAAYGCPFLYARCRTLYGSVLVATGHWAAGRAGAAAGGGDGRRGRPGGRQRRRRPAGRPAPAPGTPRGGGPPAAGARGGAPGQRGGGGAAPGPGRPARRHGPPAGATCARWQTATWRRPPRWPSSCAPDWPRATPRRPAWPRGA